MASQQSYTPSPAPVVDDPKLQEVVDWAHNELALMYNFFTNFSVLQQNVLHVEPEKPREGMKVVADGTDWDPGSGLGTYTYLGGVWVFESLQVDLTPFMTKAANLSDVANAATSRDNLGVEIGADVLAFDAQLFSNVPQNSKSAAYTTVLTDGQKHIFHPSSDNNARTFTIDSNANVAYPIGTAITFVNEINVVTIAITSDTLTWLPSGGTGSRSLAANGMATALKVASTKWVISGVGLS